ncbi:hypothetical protein ACFV3R_02750 [Streptomyces sp. NPDC059740]|uniref:hypothetical protein n=1 Tax=Streptomyces sp. NPDC059740 TaxID=3346926 RepID=UPI003659CE16
MSQSEDDPNTPLPRVAKDSALNWARDYTVYMARLTDVDLDASTEKVNWEACVGENNEVAKDGRYSLFYYIYSPAPTTEHTHVVRTLRHTLSRHGYRITGYREFKDSYTTAVFDARNEKSSYLVSAETVGSGKNKPQRLSFSVRTPCMLPPGVEQQRF